MKRRMLLTAAGLTAAGLPRPSGALSWRRREASADIAVVGGGAAGLSAALSAAETARAAGQKLRIALYEKNAELGGDTLIAGGYFNAVDPVRQKAMGIDDSPELFEKQMLEASSGGCSPALVRQLAFGAADAVRWLESYGLTFLPKLFAIFGSPFPRAHLPALSSGRAYIRTLAQAAWAAGIRIEQSAPVRELLWTDGRIRGLAFDDGVCRAASVILASGGFAANRAMLAEHAPALAGLPVDSQPGSTGDMHLAAQKIGAALLNMPFVECIPGAGSGVPYDVRLDYRPDRMILVDEDGLRFVEENASRFEIASAVVARSPRRIWALADQALVSDLDIRQQKNLYQGLYAGSAHREPTIDRLSARTGIRLEGLESTLGRSPARERIQRAPFWAVPVHLRVHATLGGIRISPRAEVLDREGRAMPGLWAAGDVTGGVHGRSRMGGNGINTAVVFGRIAGRMAAESALAMR